MRNKNEFPELDSNQHKEIQSLLSYLLDDPGVYFGIFKLRCFKECLCQTDT